MTHLPAGTAHDTIPDDLEKALLGSNKAAAAWQSLTPLARNEWVCYVVSPKQQQTRDQHVVRTVEDLEKGKRRPCCWIGCIHRTDKEISPSVRGILEKQNKL